MKKLLFIFSLILFCTLPAQGRMKDYHNIMKSQSIYELDAFLRDAHEDDPRRDIIKPRLMALIKDYIKDAHPADSRVKSLQEMYAILEKRPSTRISFEEMSATIKQKQIAKYKEALAKNLNPATMASVTIPEENKNQVSGGISNPTSGNNVGVNMPKVANYGMSSSEDTEYKNLMNETSAAHKEKTVKILNKLFDNDPTSKESIVMVQNKSKCNIIVRIEGPGNLNYVLPVAAQNENSIVVNKGNYLFRSVVCGAQYTSQKTVQKAIMVALNNK